MDNKAAYYALSRELVDIQARNKIFLIDENEDAQNALDAGYKYNSNEFWACMIENASMNAGMRAEEAGQNINDLIGRVIY